MNAHFDELYLRWLYGQICPLRVRNPARTYWAFTKQLFCKEFVWFVPNDDNRLSDGLEVRYEFFDVCEVDSIDELWANLGCSMLEMLIALSRRLSFMTDREPRDCFWTLIENLGIEDHSDLAYSKNPELVRKTDRLLDQLIWRTYDYDGVGGLFPLKHPTKDQRKVELWYQMSAWVMEQEEV